MSEHKLLPKDGRIVATVERDAEGKAVLNENGVLSFKAFYLTTKDQFENPDKLFTTPITLGAKEGNTVLDVSGVTSADLKIYVYNDKEKKVPDRPYSNWLFDKNDARKAPAASLPEIEIIAGEDKATRLETTDIIGAKAGMNVKLLKGRASVDLTERDARKVKGMDDELKQHVSTYELLQDMKFGGESLGVSSDGKYSLTSRSNEVFIEEEPKSQSPGEKLKKAHHFTVVSGRLDFTYKNEPVFTLSGDQGSNNQRKAQDGERLLKEFTKLAQDNAREETKKKGLEESLKKAKGLKAKSLGSELEKTSKRISFNGKKIDEEMKKVKKLNLVEEGYVPPEGTAIKTDSAKKDEKKEDKKGAMKEEDDPIAKKEKEFAKENAGTGKLREALEKQFTVIKEDFWGTDDKGKVNSKPKFRYSDDYGFEFDKNKKDENGNLIPEYTQRVVFMKSLTELSKDEFIKKRDKVAEKHNTNMGQTTATTELRREITYAVLDEFFEKKDKADYKELKDIAKRMTTAIDDTVKDIRSHRNYRLADKIEGFGKGIKKILEEDAKGKKTTMSVSPELDSPDMQHAFAAFRVALGAYVQNPLADSSGTSVPGTPGGGRYI